jgi:arginyl-tRNA--protein-N-Asp/Glu arginylyltransferase
MASLPVCAGQQNKKTQIIRATNEIDMARQIGFWLEWGATPEVVNGQMAMVMQNINRCSSCLSTRIDLHRFEPDRAMKRAIKGFRGNVTLDPVVLTPHTDIGRRHLVEHETLLRQYVLNRAPGRFYEGWANVIQSAEFAAFTQDSRRLTLAFRDAHDGKLLGGTQIVRGLLERNGRSEVVAYGASNYYSADNQHSQSPGIAQICATIAWLQAQGARYLYMGHTTLHEGPFHYKLRFDPDLRPSEGNWVRCDRILETVGNRKTCGGKAPNPSAVS